MNTFDETKSAVQFELTIQKLDVQRKLKELNSQVDSLEKRLHQGANIDKARDFDALRASLFELKKQQ